MILTVLDWYIVSDADETHVQILKERYLCPHFRILVIGRANAGKTTILEKVCGVAKGTKPIIYDKDGKVTLNFFVLPLTVVFLAGNQLEQSAIHLMPSLEVSQIINDVWDGLFLCNDNREACIILSIKLHTLEVTLSSMTLRVLNLVQLRNWRLFGNSLGRSLQKLS
jgi:hypothetical protein